VDQLAVVEGADRSAGGMSARINEGVAMITAREERQKELQAMLATQDGLLAIMQLYHQKVAPPGRPGSLGRIGLLGSQMIPRILDAEFPKADER
jgi:hypothetical protein